jgi:hypothetical protein
MIDEIIWFVSFSVVQELYFELVVVLAWWH